ncbi:MAG TPA: sulfite exporter TauE/SafE family protein [bacterium]|nr:sulfite exporter TauE/SafE family protein [bacterium]
MIHWSDLPLLGLVAAFSAFVGSVAGSGGSTILLPVLVLFYGIRAAVPIVTIANLSANVSRSVINRREIVLSIVGWFVLGAIPSNALGAWLFTIAAPELLTRLLGAVLITVVVWRRLRPRPPSKRAHVWFLPVGTGFGFLEGIMGSVGPLMAPFFLAAGLVKNAYIGTDALATVAMQSTKLAVFGGANLLSPGILLAGFTLVPFMILGTVIGKRTLDRLPDRAFTLLIEGVLVLAGLNFLIRG